jgi:hypothetical protein
VSADGQFTALAGEYLDELVRRHPDEATDLGDHRFDDRLPERTRASLAAERLALGGFKARLAELTEPAGATGAAGPDRTGPDSAGPDHAGPDRVLTPELAVDAAMLAEALDRRIFEIDELREDEWDPLAANPGRAIYGLVARDFAPLPDRLVSVAGRLAQIPAALADARGLLDPAALPKVHLETAVGQFDGTIALISREIPEGTGPAKELARARQAALTALVEHRDWLRARLTGGGDNARDSDFADPRIGPGKFARKLSLTLSAAAGADTILARAEADLDRATAEITALASDLGGTPREVLDRLAADAPDGDTILRLAEDAFNAQVAFVGDHDLVTLYDDPIKLIPMPEIDRGVAVAYCDSPGPLEQAPLPTFIAVSPPPEGWAADRVASFYREYNRHMAHDLMVHEAMPGHYLQLEHARRFAGGTKLRAALSSGSFIEGWAVYAEELMADHGYPGEGDPRAVRMQQLKMQLRTIINAILDARVHAHGMTEAEAMALMTGRGFQEESEAAGKWRRALLTSTQLSTYYVGYTEVADLARELLAVPGASPRAVHDRILAHGSPPVRLLREVI